MDLNIIKEYSLSLKGSREYFPFDEETLVFKVADKIFLITNIFSPQKITIKATPEKSLKLRAKYEEITPGYHMNKKHWITIDISTGRFTREQIETLIKESYTLVFNGLTRHQKEQVNYSSPR